MASAISASAMRPAVRSKTAFTGVRIAAPRARVNGARRVTVMAGGQAFPDNWIRTDPLVPVLGFLGWTIPANIPVSAFGGKSLFGLLLADIGTELAHFPTGPALNSPFWLHLVLYHVGLFLCIFLGQIGVQGRKQGYW